MASWKSPTGQSQVHCAWAEGKSEPYLYPNDRNIYIAATLSKTPQGTRWPAYSSVCSILLSESRLKALPSTQTANTNCYGLTAILQPIWRQALESLDSFGTILRVNCDTFRWEFSYVGDSMIFRHDCPGPAAKLLTLPRLPCVTQELRCLTIGREFPGSRHYAR